MNISEYNEISEFMQKCMCDSAHDREHVMRVLKLALDIAEYEENVDYDILIASCLLHDIGRKEQIENSKLCHARVGSEKAYDYLLSRGWSNACAGAVRDCIYTHRFRSDNPPKTMEAKILFDADKIDVCGAMGIARSLIYRGSVSEPLYTLNEDGSVNDGSDTLEPSFFREYHFKLKKLYGRFFTKRGREIGEKRRKAAEDFYSALLSEVQDSHFDGAQNAKKICSI
ncbi:MAG: HD domain-containing protein [Ruminococcaceae bacterium]|nr:HD domain-containing protein [Oscillospiraceae bacterium]